MIGFILTIAAIFAAGLALSDRLWRRDGDEPGGCERTLSAATIGIALWVAANWVLALTHQFTRLPLVAVAAALAAVAVALRPRLALPRFSALVLPIALWALFALWKGAVLAPQSHDALAYHLPKAVLIMRAHGFEHFAAPDVRITNLPANYELMLADVLVMSGSDRLTEWINTLSFLLFLCAAGAFAERWWPAAPHRAAVALATATAPLLLLHSAADKNDIPACLFAAAALLWGARWIARGGRMPMLLLVLSLALVGGTKPSAGAIAVGLAPFVLLQLRRLRPRDVALTAALAVAAFLLLGGASYIDNVLHTRAPIAVRVGDLQAGSGVRIEWGDFQNLWQVPILMLIVPFVPLSMAVWVPWRNELWYWPHHEIYFSHYGGVISILALLLPFAVVRFRRVGDDAVRRERRAASIAGAIAVALILPLHLHPTGMFAALPRYIAFILPIIVAWTVPPMLEQLPARRTRVMILSALAAVFTLIAVDTAINDRFGPLEFVIEAARHPGTRRVAFTNLRAGLVVDRLAGPYDTIAVDGGFDTWVYPAYGARLTRPVIFLPENATPADIPPAAKWVMIDRSWNKVWENPNFTDMGQAWTYLGKGTPKPQEVQLFNALRRDPHWVLVFYAQRLNNAVFRRAG